MSWSWKLGRVAGIPIYVHWTFVILLAWIVLGYWFESHDLTRTLEGGGLIVTLFGCVVLHELGHALAARRFGVSTSDITLLPIGGVARLQRIPERPIQELIIALAGPAVNVVIFAVLFLFGVRFPGNGNDAFDLVPGQFWSRILQINAILAAFNMLPAFPMDGGPGAPRPPGDAAALRPGHPVRGLHRPGHGHRIRISWLLVLTDAHAGCACSSGSAPRPKPSRWKSASP